MAIQEQLNIAVVLGKLLFAHERREIITFMTTQDWIGLGLSYTYAGGLLFLSAIFGTV